MRKDLAGAIKNLYSPITFIIVAAFLVRFWGMWVASFYIDEAILVDRARKVMIFQDLLNPRFSETSIVYGMFASYVHAFFMALHYIVGLFLNFWSNPSEAYEKLRYSARFASVLAGTFTVLFAYLSGKALFDKKVGIFAALVVTFGFNHVAQSKYSMVDVLATFFVAGSFYYAIWIFKGEGSTYNYILSGAYAALAINLKYNFVTLIPLAIAHMVSTAEGQSYTNIRRLLPKLLFHPKYLLSLGVVPVVYALATPYCILHPVDFYNQLSPVLKYSIDFPYGVRDWDGIPNWLWYIEYLMDSGLYYPFFFALIAGSLTIIWKYPKYALLLLSYPLLLFLVMESYTQRTDRYPVFFMPFFSIVIGLFFANLWECKDTLSLFGLKTRYLARCIVLFSIAFSAVRVILFDIAIAQEQDTKEIASKWLENNVAKNASIFLLDVDGKGFSAPNTDFIYGHGVQEYLDPKSTSSRNIYRFPGEYIVSTSFVYEPVEHLFKRNPDLKIFYPRTPPTMEYYKSWLKEMRYIKFLLDKATLVKTISHPLFGRGFYNSNWWAGGSTETCISFQPTVRIYQIPAISDIPPAKSRYLPADIWTSSRAKLVEDAEATGGEAIYTDEKTRSNRPDPGFPLDFAVRAIYLPPGKFEILYSLKASLDSSERNELCNIVAHDRKGERKKKTIRREDIPEQKGYTPLILELDLEATTVMSFGIDVVQKDLKLWVDRIEIVQLKNTL